VESRREVDQAEAREVSEMLNYQLCNLMQLYAISVQYNIPEIKLAVLHCAGEYDEERVRNIWTDLLTKGF